MYEHVCWRYQVEAQRDEDARAQYDAAALRKRVLSIAHEEAEALWQTHVAEEDAAADAASTSNADRVVVGALASRRAREASEATVKSTASIHA